MASISRKMAHWAIAACLLLKVYPALRSYERSISLTGVPVSGTDPYLGRHWWRHIDQITSLSGQRLLSDREPTVGFAQLSNTTNGLSIDREWMTRRRQGSIEDGTRVDVGSRLGIAASKPFLNIFDGREYVEVFFAETNEISHVLTSKVKFKGPPDLTLEKRCEAVWEVCSKRGSLLLAVKEAFRQYAELPALGQRRMNGGEESIEWLSWANLRQKVERVATTLKHAGVPKNGRVIIFGENSAEIAIVILACFFGEYIPASLHHNIGDDGVRFAVEEVQAAAAFVDDSHIGAVADATGTNFRLLVSFQDVAGGLAETVRGKHPHAALGSFAQVLEGQLEIAPCISSACPQLDTPVWAADTALLLFTSGSTGVPKSARVSHENLFAETCESMYCSKESSVSIMNQQMSTSATPYTLLDSHLTGGRNVVYLPVEDMYSISRLAWPTGISGTPEMYLLLYANYESDLAMAITDEYRKKMAKKYAAALGPRIRGINCGGAKPNPTVMTWLAKTFPNASVTENYASTEAGPITYKYNGETRMVNNAIKVRLVAFGDYKPSDVPPRGELVVKSPTTFAGYLDKTKTSEAFTKDGWYKTGDIVRMEKNAFGEKVPIVIDRKKATFKLKNGDWVSPVKVENRLEGSPLVRQAFVYGDSRASALVCLIVPTEGAKDRWLEGTSGESNSVSGASGVQESFEKAVLQSMQKAGKQSPELRHFEVPQRLHIIEEPFEHRPGDDSNDLLTVSHKKNRRRIETRYKKELEAMMTSLADEMLHAMQEKAEKMIDSLERILRSPTLSAQPATNLDVIHLSSIEAMFVEGRLHAHFEFEANQFPGMVSLLLDGEMVGIARGIAQIRQGGIADAGEEPLEYWRKELTLPDSLMRSGDGGVSQPPVPNLEDNAVLLTGATAFVGRSLLRDLLARPENSTIYCLVRGNTTVEATQRLRKLMRKQGYTEALGAAWVRVRVVTGDFTRENLGVGTQEYASLAEEVGTIFHVGSLVDHVLSYKRLRDSNVGSVLGILRLAVLGRPKAVHYCSTYSVLPSGTGGNEIIEGGGLPVSLDALARLAVDMERQGWGGYSLSKFVGEALVRAARQRGVPSFVHRLSMISFDTRTGAANAADWITRFLRGAVQLQRYYIKPGTTLWTTPVDFLSRAMLALAIDSPKGFYTYQHPEFELDALNLMMRLKDTLAMRSSGRSLELVRSLSEWQKIWKGLPHSNAMYPLRHNFAEGLPEYNKSNSRETLRVLRRHSGFEDPAFTEQGLESLTLSLLRHAGSRSVEMDARKAQLTRQVKDPTVGSLWLVFDANAWSPVGGLGGDEENFLLNQLSFEEAATIRGSPTRTPSQLLERKERLIGYLLTRHAVAQSLDVPHADIQIRRPHQLRPYVAAATLASSPVRSKAAPNFNFNIGHEDGWVAFLSDGVALVGVDVSNANTFKGQTAAMIIGHFNSTLAESEQALLNASARPCQEFGKLWALKEAFVKARGDGLAFGDLRGAAFEPNFPTGPRLMLHGRLATEWVFGLKQISAERWLATARGPPDAVPDKADPSGEFRSTLLWPKIGGNATAWAKLQAHQRPSLRVVTVKDLLPENVREDYQQLITTA